MTPISKPLAGNWRQAVDEDAQRILSIHARSFRWGQRFLPSATARDVAVIYAFCRIADDAVDEAPSWAKGEEALGRIRAEVRGQTERRPLLRRFMEIVDKLEIPVHAIEDLLDGIENDATTVRVQNDDELIQYSYRVAGTVGIFMFHALRVKEENALAKAIDLGIAMQLTNICRDVREDWERGRVYLPASRLGLTENNDLMQQRSKVASVVRDLLDMADEYYDSGFSGLKAIPWSARFAILIAARLYRAIGHRLRRNGCDALSGRTRISPMRKIGILSRALFRMPFLRGRGRHRTELHAPIRGLLGSPHRD